MFQRTTATEKILSLRKRIQVIAGGTSASKTISALMKLIDMAQSDDVPTLTSVVSETMPHLRRGAMRDFLNIMQDRGYYKDSAWNRTNFIYTFETGSTMEFFSADSPSKTRGPRRDRLFINEGNNIKWEAADQMMVRTRQLIIIDFNPTNEFWAYEEIIRNPDRDCDFLTLTYKDNEALAPEIITDIEAHKSNKNWWKVYGLGQLGESEAMVYKGWRMIDEIPHEARCLRRGLDFGYSNHPSALGAVYYYNGGFIFDEELYRKGMSNQDIYDKVELLPSPQKLIIADSAEPKSIAELQILGANIIGANKGSGSVSQGIQFVQAQPISMTKRSVNAWKEYRNYMWLTDKDGKITNEPEDAWNHFLDAIRYALEPEMPVKRRKEERMVTGNVEALIY